MRSAHLARPIRSASTLMAFVGLVFGLLLAPASVPRAEAASPPTQAVHTSSPQPAAAKDTSLKCAKAAEKQAKKNKKNKYWVCLGSKASYMPKTTASPDVAAKGAGKISTKDVSDDDVRCENVPECTNIRTLYKADIKANALYGYGGEIWGAFDVIYNQNFNGASSRYRLTLIWDYGYEIDSQYWTAQVRKDLTGLPDPTTGAAYFYPDAISAVAYSQVRPSSTGYTSTQPTTYKGKHHDDLYGSFIANGQVWGTATTHLPNFHCPSGKCKYYGPTGPV